MKFTRRPRYGSFQETARKRAAVVRRHKKEQDSYPLLVEHISRAQPSVEDVMRTRAHQWDNSEIEFRLLIAKQWREVRARYYALTTDQRKLINSRADIYGGALNPIAYSYFIRDLVNHRPQES